MSLDLRYYFLQPEKFPVADFPAGAETPAQLLAAVKDYLHNTLVLPGVHENNAVVKCGSLHIDGPCRIGAGTVVYGDVTIIGPVHIGKNCEIMAGAVIRPNTIIGDGCSIGHGAELKHTILYDGAKVASLSFVGNSVLGASARVGSGVITANRKFNQSNVTLNLDGIRHDLGDSYFGVVLGDSARLGANCVTQPGAHIGPYSWVLPMTNVRGFIPREKRVYHPQDTVMEENGIVELKP